MWVPPETVKETVPPLWTLIPKPPASAAACAAQPADPVAKLQLAGTRAGAGSGGAGGASGGGKGSGGPATTGGFGGAWQPEATSSNPTARPFVSAAGRRRRRGVWSNLGTPCSPYQVEQIRRLDDFAATMNGGLLPQFAGARNRGMMDR